MRKRIEGSIVQVLIDQGGLVGEFQEPDYRYQKPKIRASVIKLLMLKGLMEGGCAEESLEERIAQEVDNPQRKEEWNPDGRGH